MPASLCVIPTVAEAPDSVDRLGHAQSIIDILLPYIKEGDHVVKLVHCRAYYSVALLESGLLLLLSPNVLERHGTVLPSDGEAVVDVAAGDTHIVFCTASGAVYSCGYGNRYGQLGNGSVWDFQPSPTMVDAALTLLLSDTLDDERHHTPHSESTRRDQEGLREWRGTGELPAVQPARTNDKEGDNGVSEWGLSPLVGPLPGMPPRAPRAPSSVPPPPPVPWLTAPQRVPGFGRCRSPTPPRDAARSSDSGPAGSTTHEPLLPCPVATATAPAAAVVNSKGEGQPEISALLSPSGEDGTGEEAALSASSCPVTSERKLVCISAVACGATHTLLLSAAGNAVYACGRGHCGQLSGPRPVPLQPSFRSIRLLFGLPIAKVAAAGNHSFVLLRTGKLLGFGENQCGQLGLGNTTNVIRPSPAQFLLQHTEDHLMGRHGGSGGDGATALGPATEKELTGSTSAAGRRLLDAKAFSSLRAPYASVKGAHFPLRVDRLDAELESADSQAVTSVWCCETLTVARTVDGSWYSCGLACSRSWQLPGVAGSGGGGGLRYDGYGVLGRPLTSRSDAYLLGRMGWSRAVQESLGEAGSAEPVTWSQRDTEGGGTGCGDADGQESGEMVCLCYPHAVVVSPAATHSDDNSADMPNEARSTPSVILLQTDAVGEPWTAYTQSDVYAQVVADGAAVASPKPDEEGAGGEDPLMARVTRDDATHVRYTSSKALTLLPLRNCVLVL